MRNSKLSKLIGAGVLATGLAVLPLTIPASAQTSSPSDTTTTSPSDTTAAPSQSVDPDRGDRDFDWGWLGLLGLAGLAGLAGNKRREPVAYREPDTTRSTTYRE